MENARATEEECTAGGVDRSGWGGEISSCCEGRRKERTDTGVDDVGEYGDPKTVHCGHSISFSSTQESGRRTGCDVRTASSSGGASFDGGEKQRVV